MAVDITALQLAAAIRLGDGTTALIEPESSIMTRLLAVSTELVERYAPDAPIAVQNEACVRISGYLYDAPPVGREELYANAAANSGARALLAPWRPIRVRTVL